MWEWLDAGAAAGPHSSTQFDGCCPPQKKKKAGGGAAAGGGGGSQPPVDPAAKKEGERRFQASLAIAGRTNADGCWLVLLVGTGWGTCITSQLFVAVEPAHACTPRRAQHPLPSYSWSGQLYIDSPACSPRPHPQTWLSPPGCCAFTTSLLPALKPTLPSLPPSPPDHPALLACPPWCPTYLCLVQQEAVDQLSHNSEDSMWVKLGACHLADGKMKKVGAAGIAWAVGA